MAAPAKDKGVDLAVIFGGKSKGKGGSEEPPMSELDAEEPMADEGDTLPPGFETDVEEAFSAEDPAARAQALYRAIQACKGM